MTQALLPLADSLLSFGLIVIPIGVIGLWRWGVWVTKVIVGSFYRPQEAPFHTSVSVITPVYNEQPEVFAAALRSWAADRPDEIVAVVDATDIACVETFAVFSRTFPGARLVVTEKPGKRAALADGIRLARSEIVALVDSDTVWGSGVLAAARAPFRDPRIGGVATRQNVLAPKTLAQKIFDIQLDQRYNDEIPFLAVSGTVLRCLSGRTAFYRRSAVAPLLPDLEQETFWGQPVISGDDKRLTYLIQAAGWRTTYQRTACVYTPGVPSLRVFLQQRLRWSRNSWRADLRALSERWTWRHPVFALALIDNSLQAFTLLLSPLFVLLSVVFGLWAQALAVLLWWHATRFIRLSPHFQRRPRDICILPVFIIANFVTGAIRLYALFSLNEQGWITRWDAERLPRPRHRQRLVAAAATALAFLLLAGGVVFGTKRDQPTEAVARSGPSPAHSRERLPVAGVRAR